MSALKARLGRLEEKAGHREPSLSGRMFECVVRKHREEEDKAVAFEAFGAVPTGDDWVICFVTVSPNKDDPMEHFAPQARLISDHNARPNAL